jgi:hypothetical protein
MNAVELALRTIAADLDRRAVGWALVGGFAVSIRSEPRFTRDVDVAIAVPGDPEAEALVRSLMAAGYQVLASVEQDAAGRLATARLAPPGGAESGAIVDLLFASSGIEPEIVEAADSIEVLPELFMRVARAGHLIALKLLARDDDTRPQDAADLRALALVADDSDLRLAEQAVALIEARGYHRERNLAVALAMLRPSR